MGHGTQINGVQRDITGGVTLVNGVQRKITKGLTLVGGVQREIPFMSGIRIGDIAIGSSVYANVGGLTKEFIVVNQGKPSSVYDDSCDGTWLLMKDVYENNVQWSSSNTNKYESSTIHTYLNGAFLNLFDAVIKSKIKTVKLPYRKGGGKGGTIQQGANGISTQIFLLSGPEVSFVDSDMDSGEGSVLSYFNGCSTTGADSKRIAYLNGTATRWWLRSPSTGYTNTVWLVNTYGIVNTSDSSNSWGLRPAFILPQKTRVNERFEIIA